MTGCFKDHALRPARRAISACAPCADCPSRYSVAGISACHVRANQADRPAQPASCRGTYASSRYVEVGRDGRDGCARRALSRYVRRSRDVLIPRCWYQARDMLRMAWVMVANKPGAPGRPRISRQTMRAGKAGMSCRTCGSAACFFAARGPWERRAPGLPCPSRFSLGLSRCIPRARCAARPRSHEQEREDAGKTLTAPSTVIARAGGRSSTPQQMLSTAAPRRTGSPGQAGR